MCRCNLSHHEWKDQLPQCHLHGHRRRLDAAPHGFEQHRIYTELTSSPEVLSSRPGQEVPAAPFRKGMRICLPPIFSLIWKADSEGKSRILEQLRHSQRKFVRNHRALTFTV